MNIDASTEQELTDALLRMMKVASRDNTLVDGTINDVDLTRYTCDVLVKDASSEVLFSDVPLETVINSQASFIFIPNIGSHCVICFRDGNKDRPQLFKVDSARIIRANPTELWQFGDGSNGGLVLVRPTVDHVNVIEKNLNALRDLIQAWVAIPGDGGASLKVALASWLTDSITPTVEKDLANPKVTQ